MVEHHQFRVRSSGERLDRYLATHSPGFTRARLQQLIDGGYVLVNGSTCKPSYRVREADIVCVSIPEPEPSSLEPEPIPLKVVYQDEHLLVVDKPAGLTVHPAPGHPRGTLVNALLAACPDLGSIGDVIRPGIVHRLDKDTSGLLVIAKSQAVHHHLSDQIKARAIKKVYLALATGLVERGRREVRAPIGRDRRNRKRMTVVEGGRDSVTRYEVLEYVGGCSLLEVFPETGRTHQIRVHLAYLGHPLLGDKVYGKGIPTLSRHFLHACRLGFQHPGTGRWLELASPLPEELEGVLQLLRMEGPGRGDSPPIAKKKGVLAW